MFVAPLTSPLPFEKLPKHTQNFEASKKNQQEANVKAALESTERHNDHPPQKTRSWLSTWLHKHSSSDSLWSRTRHRRSDSQSMDERTYYELARGRAV